MTHMACPTAPSPPPSPECRSLASSGSVERGPFPDKLYSGHPPVACVDYHHTLVSAVLLTHRDGHLHALLWFWVFLKHQEKKKKPGVAREVRALICLLPFLLSSPRSHFLFLISLIPFYFILSLESRTREFDSWRARYNHVCPQLPRTPIDGRSGSGEGEVQGRARRPEVPPAWWSQPF